MTITTVDDLAAAVAALRAGQVVGVPTDTVYGLAVDPSVDGATDRLYAVKRRPVDVDLPLLVADAAQAAPLAEPDGWRRAAPVVDAFWPGPLTVVVRRAAGLEWSLGRSRSTVGLRCPDHAVMRELCRRVGPLAVSSANRHGEPPLQLATEVHQRFGDEVSAVVDGGRCSGAPSTVADLTSDPPVCIRAGGLSWDEVVRVAQARSFGGGPKPA